MLRVGLTGGIGSGKSTVASMFASLGVHVIEADAIGRQLMEPGQTVYQAIVEQFGTEILRPDGALDRRKLAEIAFGQKRIEELNKIVHPAVIAEQEAWAERLFAADPLAILMVESALIFEAERSGTVPEWRRRFDRLILVTVPDEMKVQRYVQRISPEKWDESLAADAWSRIAAQLPDKQKAPLCDYVIENTAGREHTMVQVKSIHQELLRLTHATPERNSA